MGKYDLMQLGKLQKLTIEIKQIVLRIDNSCKSIAQNLYLYDGVENLEIEAADAEFAELKKSFYRYKVLAKEIREIDPDTIIPMSPAEC